ncbi:hypothetical protein BGY98DRAFT_1030159, partial [Russula aff. rugulosa BPL654]
MFVLIFLSPLVPLSIFFFLISCFPSPPRARQQDIPQAAAQDEIRVPFTFLPPLVASPLQLSFLLRLLTRLLGQHLPTQTPPCSSHTPPFLRITYY